MIRYSTDQLVYRQLESFDRSSNDPLVMYRNFFSYWYRHRQFLTLLYKNNLFELFMNTFISDCYEALHYPLLERSMLDTDDPKILRTFRNSFIVGGLAQMLKQWTAESFQTSIDQIAGSIIFLAPSAHTS